MPYVFTYGGGESQAGFELAITKGTATVSPNYYGGGTELTTEESRVGGSRLFILHNFVCPGAEFAFTGDIMASSNSFYTANTAIYRLTNAQIYGTTKVAIETTGGTTTILETRGTTPSTKTVTNFLGFSNEGFGFFPKRVLTTKIATGTAYSYTTQSYDMPLLTSTSNWLDATSPKYSFTGQASYSEVNFTDPEKTITATFVTSRCVGAAIWAYEVPVPVFSFVYSIQDYVDNASGTIVTNSGYRVDDNAFWGAPVLVSRRFSSPADTGAFYSVPTGNTNYFGLLLTAGPWQSSSQLALTVTEANYLGTRTIASSYPDVAFFFVAGSTRFPAIDVQSYTVSYLKSGGITPTVTGSGPYTTGTAYVDIQDPTATVSFKSGVNALLRPQLAIDDVALLNFGSFYRTSSTPYPITYTISGSVEKYGFSYETRYLNTVDDPLNYEIGYFVPAFSKFIYSTTAYIGNSVTTNSFYTRSYRQSMNGTVIDTPKTYVGTTTNCQFTFTLSNQPSTRTFTINRKYIETISQKTTTNSDYPSAVIGSLSKTYSSFSGKRPLSETLQSSATSSSTNLFTISIQTLEESALQSSLGHIYMGQPEYPTYGEAVGQANAYQNENYGANMNRTEIFVDSRADYPNYPVGQYMNIGTKTSSGFYGVLHGKIFTASSAVTSGYIRPLQYAYPNMTSFSWARAYSRLAGTAQLTYI
jgi:hypothetical protein